MKITDHIKAAFFNLLGAKLRSFLAVLGILIGTASVVALIMSGELATQHALAQFKSLGTNLLSVSVYQSSQGDNASGAKVSSLSYQQALDSDLADKKITEVAPYTMAYSSVYYNDKDLNANAIGAGTSLADVIRIQMASGRFISDLDRRQHYAVVGAEVAESLEEAGLKKILGHQISIGNAMFTIIGIAKKWPENSFFDQDINSSVIIPIGTSFTLSKETRIQNIVYRFQQGADIDSIKDSLHNYISQYMGQSQIFVRSPQQIISSMKKQQDTFTILLGVIGGISLLVGGIGVMNIMLVSVIERRREIGIRRAVGARQSHIRWLFLGESIALSLFGGTLGVIFGIISSYIIAIVFKWDFVFFASPAIIGFVVSVLIGIFFGFYPAVRASKLDPIQLLRSV